MGMGGNSNQMGGQMNNAMGAQMTQQMGNQMNNANMQMNTPNMNAMQMQMEVSAA